MDIRMNDRDGEETDENNRGQTDGAKGVYNPPDITPGIFSIVTTDRQRAAEWANKEAYDKGWENGHKNR
jgi:hypothetical protein